MASVAAPITVSQPITLKAKAWKAGLAPSGVSSATYTFPLEAPTVTPAGGLYPTAQSVTLSAAAGATIRYTTTGADPTESSPAYSAPLTVSTSLTLKVRAFKSGWLPSPVRTEEFAIGQDTTAPVVRAQPRPGLNAAGWAMTPTTVFFACTDAQAGIASCPAPFAVTQETAGVTVTGTATDRAGLTATTSIVVRVDTTPPAVEMSAPQDGATTTAETITNSHTSSAQDS